MNLYAARKIAESVVLKLSPYCDRIQIAGSIRRERPEVNDIEIVCIPKRYESFDLLGNSEGFLPIQEFVHTVRQWGKVRGEPFGKYTRRVLPEGIELDLFMVTKDNWGLILAIRTGSADYSHKILARGWTAKGYRGEGMLIDPNGNPVPVPEEVDLFRLIGIPWATPRMREVP